MYGDIQAQMTMNRAAYGDVPAAMMSGGGFYGGAAQGMHNMMSDIGQYVMPVTYTPPARYHAGYYGMYQQHNTMMRGLAGMAGIGSVPRGTTALEYNNSMAGDFGERYAAGLAGAGLTLGGIGAAQLMSPITGMAGRAIGGAAGAALGMEGIGAGIGAIAGGTVLPFMAAAAVTSGITNAVSQRREVQSFLEQSSFRFVGAGSGMADTMMGGGMNVGSRQQATEFMRKMDVTDPRMGMKDLTQVLEQGTQLGLFNGTKDMDDFKTKFKDITEAVKNVTRTLHQTLEEGMKTIKDLKGIGVDPSQVKGVVMEADMLGKMAGRTGGEMLGLGLQGAEMFRGTGVTMAIGAQATMMNLASVRASRDAGVLSQEAIVQAGGEEALAMRQTAGGLAFAQSSMGRGNMAAFFNGAGGANTQSFMSNVMQGGGNFVGNAQAAAGNLGSPAALISYQANQSKIMSEIGATFGGRGLQIAENATMASYASYLAGATGAKREDAFRLVMKQSGKSDAEVDAVLGEARGAEKIFQSSQSAIEATRSKSAMEEAHNNFIFANVGKKISNAASQVYDVVASPISEYYDNARQGAKDWVNSQVYGAQRIDARGVLAGGSGPAMHFDAVGGRMGPINLDKGGLLAGNTAGTAAMKALQANGGELASALGIDVRSGYLGAKSGDVILKDTGGVQTFVSGNALQDAATLKKLEVMGMSDEQAKQMQKNGLIRGVEDNSVAKAAMAGKLHGEQTYLTLAKAVFGHTNLTASEQASLILQTEGTGLRDVVTAGRDKANTLLGSRASVGLMALEASASTFDASVSKLQGDIGLKVSPEAAKYMAMAAHVKDPKEKQALEVAAYTALAKGNSGKTADEIATGIKRGMASGGMNAIYEAAGAAEEIQARRGTSVIANVLDTQLAAKTDKEIGTDERGGLGKAIGAMGAAKTAAEFIHAVHEAPQKSLGKIESGKLALDDAMKLESISKTSGVKAADDAFKEMMGKFASKEGVVTAGGAAVDKNSSGATADQTAAVQTSQNMATLAAMQALAAKLGVH